MLRVTKVRFPQLEFKILHVLHNLRKRKQKGTSVVQANSKSKVMFHTITSLPIVFSLSTLHFKLLKLNDPIHLFWRLYCQASQYSKCRTLHSHHMHAAVHGSHVTYMYGCHLVKKSKSKAKMHSHWTALKCSESRRLSPPHPSRVRGWKCVTFQTTFQFP